MVWGFIGIAASFLEGLSISMEKKTLIREHAMEFSASLVIFAMLFSVPLWLFSNPDAISLYAVWLTFLSGLLLALSIFFFAKALRHMATPYTNPFLALSPILVALFAWRILGESISGMQWLAVVLVSFGTYLLYAHSHRNVFDPIQKAIHIPHLKYVILGIIAYSASSVLDGLIVGPSHMSVFWLNYLPLLLFFAGVVLIIMMIMFHDGFVGIGNGMRNNVHNLSILALLLLIAKGALVYALTIPGVLLSLLYSVKQVSLPISMAFSGELFHKEHALRKALACMLLIAGAALLLF